MAAVGSRVADDELQLLAGVLHKLSFKCSLFGPCGPGESLINVQQPIETHRQSDEPPAHRLPDLRHKHTGYIRLIFSQLLCLKSLDQEMMVSK